MKEIVLRSGHPFCFKFHPERLQVAYYKDYWMKPEDHGYYPNMKAYHDYEDDECISRHFDNAGLKLVTDGFLIIVDDETKEHPNFSAEHHITLSEVNRMLKECKPTKKKLKAKFKHTDEKKKEEMNSLFINILNLRANDIKTNDEIIDLIFECGAIIKKNKFTKEEFRKFVTKEL